MADQEKLDRVEKYLREAMAKAKEKGYMIARGVTVSREFPACCAFGAVQVTSDPDAINGTIFDVVAERLGLTITEVFAFIDGFDEALLSHKSSEAHPEFVALGQKLGQEFIGPR